MIKIRIRGGMIYLDYNLDGKRIKKTTKLENNKENMNIVKTIIVPQLQMKINNKDYYKEKAKTFKYYSRFFLMQKEKETKTFTDRLPYYNRVIDRFSSVDVDKITKLDIKNYMMSLNMKSKSKRIYLNTVREILEYAVDDDVIQINVANSIRLSKDEKVKIDFFNKEDVFKLINHAKDDFKVYLQIAFNTGMRPEEILALRFDDFKNGYININKVITRGRTDIPKTKYSTREVPYPSFINGDIENLMKNKSLKLFPNKKDASHFRHQWARVIKDSGVEYKKLYSTRHTFATIMLRENIISLNELAGILGHSSPKVTLQHYASVIESKKVKFAKNFSLFNDFCPKSVPQDIQKIV